MKNKRSRGITFFAVLFFLSGIWGLFSWPQYLKRLSINQEMGHQFYMTSKKLLDRAKTNASGRSGAEKEEALFSRIADAENYLELYKNKFMFDEYQLQVFWGVVNLSFICSLFYVFSGISLYRLYPAAPKFVFSSVGLSMLTKIFYYYYVGLGIKPMRVLQDKIFAITSFFHDMPGCGMSKALLIYFAIYIVVTVAYFIYVVCFFTRPGIQAQFEQAENKI